MFDLRRSLRIAIALALVWALPLAAAAQDAAAAPVDDIFRQLEQVQDTNLLIIRQMAEIERRAAAELQAAIDGGTITTTSHQEMARTFVANARTLAALMLSPIEAHEKTAGDGLMLLLQRNITMLQTVSSYAVQDRAFAAALTRYTVLQLQAEQLGRQLQDGWRRYGDILAQAAREGLVAENAFDPGARRWTLDAPVIRSTDVAAITTPPARVPAPEPAPLAPVEVAVPVAEPAADAAAVATVPEPIPSDPQRTEVALSAGITPLTPAAMLAPPAAPERLAPGEPLQAPTPLAPAVAPPTVRPALFGDWRIAPDESGRARASTPNLVAESAEIFRGLSVQCAPDGAVQYMVDGTRPFPQYRVYSNASQNSIVTAEANVVSGPEAARMTETLTSAYQWATAVSDGGRRLTLRTADDEGVLGLFSASGFQEAYEAVKTNCEAQFAVASAPPGTARLPELEPLPTADTLVELVPAPLGGDPAPAETTAAPAEPDAATPTAPVDTTVPALTPPPATVAPIPAPRIQRPVDIMNFG